MSKGLYEKQRQEGKVGKKIIISGFALLIMVVLTVGVYNLDSMDDYTRGVRAEKTQHGTEKYGEVNNNEQNNDVKTVQNVPPYCLNQI